MSISRTLTERYGALSFSRTVMRRKLPKSVFDQLVHTIEEGQRLDRRLADTIAHAMKEWALENGATHYCHWFQPLTGGTAEKHDSFLNFEDGVAIERFSGEQLIQGEPDASSFPHGGVRSTFEARGYTAWDPGTPAYIVKTPKGGILAIPSIFISYHGQALDKKTPFLRSIHVISEAAKKVCSLFGPTPRWVRTTLGAEQEYFLVDKELFDKRLDLKLTGRTLIGKASPKDQQLENHYFGSIPERVIAFMDDLDMAMHELGIPAKTRHNEVAPSQFEIASIYEFANVAADHNLILMQTMKEIARKHNLEVLLHEKPFKGVNGSGKHNNWSLEDSEGSNLLEPGNNPAQNLRFLFCLTAVLQGVNEYESLIRAAVATDGNDHRLGANEAPPAIISAFIGKQLSEILDGIASGSTNKDAVLNFLESGVAHVPEILQHTTDRNRTSPFAFTGNKFEFRAVGSEQSVAMPQTFLNVTIADAMLDLHHKVEVRREKGESVQTAVMAVMRDSLKSSERIRFEGNNYSQEWKDEAAKRGLSNQAKTPYALKIWEDDKNLSLLARHKILTKEEAKLRYLVRLEQYATRIDIEAKTLLSMLNTQVIPDVMRFQTSVSSSLIALSKASEAGNLGYIAGPQAELLKTVSTLLTEAADIKSRLDSELNRGSELHGSHKAIHYCDVILPLMAEIREKVDSMEALCDHRDWSIPTYSELLHSLKG